MKKLCFFLFIAVLLVGSVFAQDGSRRKSAEPRQRDSKAVTAVTIEGTLQLEKGIIAVASGDSVYYVPMLARYIGFIEGLKEGTKVSIEGREFRKFINPTKVTINGKSYDFAVGGPGQNNPGQKFRNDGSRPRDNSAPGRNFRPDRRNAPGSRGNRASCCG